MFKANALWIGAALGAAAMYFYDPQLGNRRRKLLFDQWQRLSHRSGRVLASETRHESNSQLGGSPAGQPAVSTAWKMASPGSSGEGEQPATWPAAQPPHVERPEQSGRFPAM